jgi:hypothetical protein
MSPFSLFQTGCVSTQNSPVRCGNLLAQTPQSSIFCLSLLNLVVGLSKVIVNFSLGNFFATAMSIKEFWNAQRDCQSRLNNKK